MRERVVNTGYDGQDPAPRRVMDAKAELAQELKGAVAACDLLSDREAADLLALFRSAQHAETTTLAAAVEGMVGALPRPFRAITKRIMFGDLVR